ncbi:MAG: hypothetical protein HXY45_16435 [Syntrophaceae bacterium]|nr:hypothetical protein [Syntrophaceae bacterium]
MSLLINDQRCNGCRTCELACSFHHGGSFSPERSSIKVTSDSREGKVQLKVDATCDLCAAEPEPLCILHCFTGALEKGR